MTEETLEFKLTDSWKKALAKGDIFPIVPEFATGSDGTNSEKMNTKALLPIQ